MRLRFSFSLTQTDVRTRYAEAVEYFKQALQLAKNVQSSQAAWTTTHLNLGHAYRKLKSEIGRAHV